MRRADIEVPNTSVDMDSWEVSACYPRGSFYPLSDGPSIRNRRITNSYFRTCSTRQSCSQAPLCVCTLRLISIQPEGTFERLRYSLGGDRPSQTAHLALSPFPDENSDGIWLVFQRRLCQDGRLGFTVSQLSYTHAARTQCQTTVKLHGVFPSYCR